MNSDLPQTHQAIKVRVDEARREARRWRAARIAHHTHGMRPLSVAHVLVGILIGVRFG
jgi:hypothetical protein